MRLLKKRWRWLAGIAITLLILSLSLYVFVREYVLPEAARSLVGWVSYDPPGGCTGEGSGINERRSAEFYGDFRFPASARNITITSQEEIDACSIFVRFALPSNDVDVFLTSTNIGSLVSALAPDEFFLFDRMPDWSIERDKMYMTGIVRPPDAPDVQAVIYENGVIYFIVLVA